MTVVIDSKKDTKQTIRKKLKKTEPAKKGFDPDKITAKFTWKGDALAVQKAMRDE